MKKLILIAVVSLFSISSFAQDGLKGTWWATSQFGYSQTKSGENKSTNFTVLPIVGVFVTPSVTVGVGVGTINIKNESASVTNANTNLFVAQPLVRKYWNVAGNFYFFGQVAAPIITGKEKESDLKISQYGLTASGGFDFFVTKNFSVEFSYNLANFSSTTIDPASGDKTTVTDFSLAHVANVESTYVGALGGSSPTLTTPLSFGFKFLF